MPKPLFCVPRLKFVDEPLMGNLNGCDEEQSSCYDCPYCYIRIDDDLKRYIELTERQKADNRQLKLFEVA